MPHGLSAGARSHYVTGNGVRKGLCLVVVLVVIRPGFLRDVLSVLLSTCRPCSQVGICGPLTYRDSCQL